MIVGGFNPRGRPFVWGLVTMFPLRVQYQAIFWSSDGFVAGDHLQYADRAGTVSR